MNLYLTNLKFLSFSSFNSCLLIDSWVWETWFDYLHSKSKLVVLLLKLWQNSDDDNVIQLRQSCNIILEKEEWALERVWAEGSWWTWNAVRIMLFTLTFRSAFVSFSIFFSLMSVQLKSRFQNWETLKNRFSFIWVHACCSWRSLKLYHEVSMFYYMIALHSHLRLSDINEIDSWRQIGMLSIIFNHFSHFQVIIDWQRIYCRREWHVETDSLDDCLWRVTAAAAFQALLWCFLFT